MRKRNKLRVLSTIMAITFLYGCQDKPANTASEAKNPQSDSEVSYGTRTETGTSGEYLNKAGYPIVNTPLEMKMMISADLTGGRDPKTNGAFQYLEELTNIKWDMNVIDKSEWSEKLSLMWTGDSMPDMIYPGIGGVDQTWKYMKMGKLMDLYPYLETYAPNFYKLLNENQDVKIGCLTPDGKLGGFCMGPMDTTDGKGQCPPEYLSINTTFLKNVNMNMPTNADELYQVLKAFKEKDANGNGVQDEMGIAFNNWTAKGLRIIFPWFGFMASKNNTFLDGDTVKFCPFMDEYKEALKYLNKLYKEELIEPQIFTITAAEVKAKGEQEPLVYGSVLTSAELLIVGEKNAVHYEPTPLFKTPNGKDMWYTRGFTFGQGAITTACKHPEAAVRWVDLFYDKEYSNIYWMGVEGQAYKRNSDGSWEWIFDNVTDKTVDAVRRKYTIQQCAAGGPSICPTEWFKANDAAEKPANEKRVAIAENADGKLRIAMPNMCFEDADITRMNELATELNAFEGEWFSSFVNGQKDIEKDWDTFIKSLKDMGADEMTKIIQDTYNAYKK